MSDVRYPVVLFDLDGTLTDPYVGIANTVRHTFTTMGVPLPDDATMRSWIGPPLDQTFRAYLGDAVLVTQALSLYRARYREQGMYENRVYAGIPALLHTLHERGSKLYVATSKLIDPALGILDHFDLAAYFEQVIGLTLDGSISSKTQVLAVATALLSTEQRAGCVMVGDTTYDVEGARANQVPCIAVSYGYGTLASLEAAQPYAIAHSVAELRALLLHEALPGE